MAISGSHVLGVPVTDSRVLDIHVAFFRVRSSGAPMDLQRIYRDARYFLIQERYADEKSSRFPETFFWLSHSQQDGDEFWFWWRPYKHLSPAWKPAGIYKYFKLNFHGFKLKPIEIMHEGKKHKAHVGKFEVYVDAMLKIEPPKWGKDTPFKRAALEVFWKRVYRKNIEMYRKELLDDAYKFQAYFKHIFEMESFTPKQQFLAQKQGLPSTEW